MVEFATGFVGWFAINSLLWFPFFLLGGSPALICLPANLVALVTFGITKRWIALGAFAAYLVNFMAWLSVPMLTPYDLYVAIYDAVTGMPTVLVLIILPLITGRSWFAP
jgi:hypothetical protein